MTQRFKRSKCLEYKDNTFIPRCKKGDIVVSVGTSPRYSVVLDTRLSEDVAYLGHTRKFLKLQIKGFAGPRLVPAKRRTILWVDSDWYAVCTPINADIERQVRLLLL